MANIRIRAKQSTMARLTRPWPADNSFFEAWTSETDGFRAYVHQDVIALIKQHAKRAGPYEVIGLLAGRICIDPKNGPYTLVMAAEGALDGEFKSSTGHVELLPSGHNNVRCRLEDAYPDREIVGWYHTHPQFTPRFSYVDADEQATWSDPNHVGIVYSGIDSTEPFGVYRGPTAILLQPLRDGELIEQAHTRNRSPEPQRVLTRGPGRNQNGETSGIQRALHSTSEVYDQDLAPTRSVRSRNLQIVMLCAIALIFAVLLGFLYWLNHRVSLVEARIVGLTNLRQEGDRNHNEGGKQMTLDDRVEQPAVAPTSTTSGPGTKGALVGGPELRPPAKSLAPEVTSRNQQRKMNRGRSERTARKQNTEANGQNEKPPDRSPGARVDVKPKETQDQPQGAKQTDKPVRP